MLWFAKLVKAPSVAPFWQVGAYYSVRRKYAENDRYIIVENMAHDERTITKDEATACFGERFQSDWAEISKMAYMEKYKDILIKGS